MNTLLDTLWYFCYITVELVVLFIVITAIVEIILMYIPQEKISKKIEKAGFFGNVIAAGFGALTPFCACSTLPMTVGFLNAGVPFGATMSFLIASPLLNPIIIACGSIGRHQSYAHICGNCLPLRCVLRLGIAKSRCSEICQKRKVEKAILLFGG